jgi:hypothetical protein
MAMVRAMKRTAASLALMLLLPACASNPTTSPEPSPACPHVLAVATGSPSADGYREAVVADNPEGYWELNEASGDIALDAAMSHPGTYVGNPLPRVPETAEAGGPCRIFDGRDDRVTVNSMTSGIDWSRGFTVEIWVRVTQRTSEEHAIAFNYPGGGNGPALLRDEPTDRFKYRDGDPGSDYHSAVSTTVPAVGSTYYLVVTVDANDLGALYVNGAEEASFVTPARPPANGGYFTIGAEYDGSTPESFWHGALDEAAVYGYALTASQVRAHWNAGGGA